MTRILQLPAAAEAQAAPSLSFSVAPAPGLALNLVLSDAQQQKLFNTQAACQAWAMALASVLTRTYSMSNEPTPGLLYDDRLTARTNGGRTKMYDVLNSGALEYGMVGNRYVVSELAVLQWLLPRSCNDILSALMTAPGLESLEKAFAEQLKRAS